MKQLLITIVALVGCGSSVPDQTIHEALGDIKAAGTDVNVLGDEDYEAVLGGTWRSQGNRRTKTVHKFKEHGCQNRRWKCGGTSGSNDE